MPVSVSTPPMPPLRNVSSRKINSEQKCRLNRSVLKTSFNAGSGWHASAIRTSGRCFRSCFDTVIKVRRDENLRIHFFLTLNNTSVIIFGSSFGRIFTATRLALRPAYTREKVYNEPTNDPSYQRSIERWIPPRYPPF